MHINMFLFCNDRRAGWCIKCCCVGSMSNIAAGVFATIINGHSHEDIDALFAMCCEVVLLVSRRSSSGLLSAFRRLSISASATETSAAAVHLEVVEEVEPEPEVGAEDHSPQPASSSSGPAPAPEAAASSSAAPASSASQPAAAPQAVPELPAWVFSDSTVRWYIVWRVRGHEDLHGLWVGRHPQCWNLLSSLLPGGAYIGSGANLRRYRDLASATAGWYSDGPCPHPTELFVLHLVD